MNGNMILNASPTAKEFPGYVFVRYSGHGNFVYHVDETRDNVLVFELEG